MRALAVSAEPGGRLSAYAEADITARHQEHGFRGRPLRPLDLQALGHELARVLTGPDVRP